MADRKGHDEYMEKLLNRLAETVLEQSDEGIVAEIRETGADPLEEVYRTGDVLRRAATVFEEVNTRLWNLGHNINPKYWSSDEQCFYNNCLTCGALVTLMLATREMRGDALAGRCCRLDRCGLTREAAG